MGLLGDDEAVFVSEIDEVALQQAALTTELVSEMRKAPKGRTAGELLKRFAGLWMEYIRHQDVRGQSQRWRGWYLVPEHGPITLTKLVELRRMLRQAARLLGDGTGGTVEIDKSPQGIANVVDLLAAGRVQYHGKYSDAQKRDLFVRQQKNYLVRFGLMTEPLQGHIALTEVGRVWSAAADSELIKLYLDVLSQIRWTWCNMPYFRFCCDLADLAGGYITYRELFNWVCHATDYSQVNDYGSVLNVYRSLDENVRSRVNDGIETQLRSLLERHISVSAFGHYRTKISDLIVAFATSGEFKLRDGAEPALVRAQRSRG
jgi:hypothetical protein